MKSVTTLNEHRQPRQNTTLVKQLSTEIMALKKQLEAQENMIENLKRQAMEDPMTGLSNRRAFEKALDDGLSFYRRYGRPGSIILIDLNSFKTINDTLGHLAGDAILKHIAGMLKAHTRSTDVVARIGGDEFCIILREANGYEALLKAAELETVIAHTPCRYEGREIHVTVSIGTASFEEATNNTDIIARADEAMYEKKHENARRASNM